MREHTLFMYRLNQIADLSNEQYEDWIFCKL